MLTYAMFSFSCTGNLDERTLRPVAITGKDLTDAEAALSRGEYRVEVRFRQYPTLGGLPIQRRFNSESATLENVGIDHGGFDILVSKEFLNCADIVAVLQEVGGEAVAKGVRGNSFLNISGLGSFFDGFLEGGFVNVVTPGYARTRVTGEFGGREYILP
jgi:hypothetical protein